MSKLYLLLQKVLVAKKLFWLYLNVPFYLNCRQGGTCFLLWQNWCSVIDRIQQRGDTCVTMPANLIFFGDESLDWLIIANLKYLNQLPSIANFMSFITSINIKSLWNPENRWNIANIFSWHLETFLVRKFENLIFVRIVNWSFTRQKCSNFQTFQWNDVRKSPKINRLEHYY